MHGKGKMTYANGVKYDGNWKDDERHGEGIMLSNDSRQESSKWNHDIKTGTHTQESPASEYGAVYVEDGYCGENGSKCEVITIQLASGALYAGGYENGKMHDKGIYQWATGATYDGWFEFGKKEGEGKMKYMNGNEYNGKYKGGKKHGEGTYTYANGDVYKGKWNYGQHEKGGTLTCKRMENGEIEIYDGEWIDDSMNDTVDLSACSSCVIL
jgi:hypothetical protein